MQNLFSKNTETKIVSEEELWELLDSECTDREFFDAQGDEHGEIDMRLVEKIEAFLETQPGCEEASEHRLHNLDFYGDGIRSLSFSVHLFKPEFVETFRKMLTGEHEPFCILCMIHADLTKDYTRIGTIAIFSNKLIVASPLAKHFVLV